MNILVLSWRGPKHPLAGGAEQVMHEHMKGWVDAGHNVDFFVSNIGGLKNREMIDGVQIIRMGYQYWGVQFSAFFYYIKNRKKYDVVVDQFHGIPFFTPLYVFKPRLAVIQETARDVWLTNPLPKPLNWLVGLLGYIGEPILFIPYIHTQFMTGSESAKKDVARYFIPPKSIHVVSHGVIVKKPKVKPKIENQKTVVYLGVISKDKGIEDALDAFKMLDKKGEYKFWVIGKAETEAYKEKIVDKVNKLGLNDKVKFWGFVSIDKKFELLSRAHVLINPSIREGWGLVNIEANAMGTPVIGYTSPGLVDSVKNRKSGYLVTQNTPKALANKIHKVLSSPKEYTRICKTSVSWANSFSWKRSKKKSLTLIENLTVNTKIS